MFYFLSRKVLNSIVITAGRMTESALTHFNTLPLKYSSLQNPLSFWLIIIRMPQLTYSINKPTLALTAFPGLMHTICDVITYKTRRHGRPFLKKFVRGKNKVQLFCFIKMLKSLLSQKNYLNLRKTPEQHRRTFKTAVNVQNLYQTHSCMRDAMRTWN